MGGLRSRLILTALLTVCSAMLLRAQVDTIAKRPFYDLNVTLNPDQVRAEGTLLVRYVNQTDTDLFRLAFAFDNPQGREDAISRVRVNRRAAEVTYLHLANGDPFEGFLVEARRSLPPNVVSEIEILFVSRAGVENSGLVLFQGDWFPRILGPAEGPLDPENRSLMDVDATLSYPVEWRGAMSGLILREDAAGNRVELFNAAAGIKNYGVLMGRNLQIFEEELYGITVRTFAPEEDRDWGSRVLRRAAEVVEYYKRRTPVTPPLVLSVVPEMSGTKQAAALFGNTIQLPYQPALDSGEIKVQVAKAVTELFWGFGGARGPNHPSNSLESGLTLYGVLLCSRETDRDTSWIAEWDSRYHAGMLARGHGAIQGEIGGENSNGFASQIGSANAFLILRMLEKTLPPGALQRAWDTAIVRHTYDNMDPALLTSLIEESGAVASPDLIEALDKGLPLMDARIRGTVNRGKVLDSWVTEVYVDRIGTGSLPLPVGAHLTDGSQVKDMLQPGMRSLVLRTPHPPLSLTIDPDLSLPLLSTAGHDSRAVTLVAQALVAEGRWSEMRHFVDDLLADGLLPTSELSQLHAQSMMHTGQYDRARDLLSDLVRKGHRDPCLGENLLLLGKVHDLLGQRAQAIEAYRSAANHAGVSVEATGYLEVPFTQR